MTRLHGSIAPLGNQRPGLRAERGVTYAHPGEVMQRLTNRRVRGLVLAAALGGLVGAASMRSLGAQQGQRPAPPQSYITGVVRSGSVPEAGVWVIAETKDLPTPFTKIVVTDDRGRFMLPELPDATYSVWVRGYGLVDSPKVQSKPGPTPLTLMATPARTPQEAAKVYPGNYWLSLMEPPAANEFPGNGSNGLGPAMLTQKDRKSVV